VNGERQRNQPQVIPLVELPDLALRRDLSDASDALAVRGYDLESPEGPWQPLSGGLEYNNYRVEHLLIDHIRSTLHVEVVREHDNADNVWTTGLDLRPESSAHQEWVEKVRAVLMRDFEPVPPRGSAAEIYERDSRIEGLLFAGSSDEPPHLLLVTLELIRNPAT
jgi:hypothetical protein